ncbi:unnamed protein product [Gadus morhua 'NCC']
MMSSRSIRAAAYRWNLDEPAPGALKRRTALGGVLAFSVKPLELAVFVEADVESERAQGVLQRRCHFALSSGGEPAGQ